MTSTGLTKPSTARLSWPRYSGTKACKLAAGPGFTHTETKTGSGNIIDSLQPFGTGVVDEIGLKAWLKYDTFNRDMAYASGLTFHAGTKWMRATGGRSYRNLFLDLRGFMSWPGPGDPTLALRGGGEWAWGEPPHYRAAFLSGSGNLKGYPANRFGGDGSLFLNSELRLRLAGVNWPFPFNFGILGIADVGRVFGPGEMSQRWHNRVGGGVWSAYSVGGKVWRLPWSRAKAPGSTSAPASLPRPRIRGDR